MSRRGSFRHILAALRRAYTPDTDVTVDAARSTATLSASTVEYPNSLTLTITARNANGKRLPGKTIDSVIALPATGITVTGSGNTNTSGIATRSIDTDASAEGTGITLTVTVDGVALNMVPSFDVTAPATGDQYFVDNYFVTNYFVPGYFVGA